MIFAADLDRTLIYSEQFIKHYQGQVRAVEYGKYTSYMTETAVQRLKELAERIIFAPCTTRTIEQYRRIQLFQDEIIPRFAVVSNGGNLIINGIVNENYSSQIRREIENSCLPAAPLLEEFKKIYPGDWAQPIREADGLFYYCLIDRLRAPLSQLSGFARWAVQQNWDLSIQGRKLYLVPKTVNKWRAVQQILEMTGENMVLAAGDSLLDLTMLNNANYAVIPRHGELYEAFGQAAGLDNGCSLEFTNNSGLLAGEEIMEKLNTRI